MKKIFDKEKLKSHNGIIFVCVVALVCCIGVVNGKLSEKGALGVSAGYEDYENEEMAAHSGDVLVDSLNLSAAREVLPMPLRTGIKPAVTARLTKMLPERRPVKRRRQ